MDDTVTNPVVPEQEVGDRIVSMNDSVPRLPTHCVLMFENENRGIVYKKGTITDAEHDLSRAGQGRALLEKLCMPTPWMTSLG
jgi:hypothetical protein